NTVLTSADLSIAKDDGVTSVTAGDGVTYTYTFTVHNAGPSDAQSVSFSDSWPAGFARGGLPAGCANVGSGPDFSCNLGTMVAGATLTRTVSYTVPSGTTASPQVNSATVSSPTSDPDTTNNTGSDSNTVLTSADLSITKDDGVTSVTAGDGVTYTYTFTVHNAGPSDAQSVSFSDSWPAGFARGGLPAGCANVGSGPDFSCNLGTMVAGATLTRTVSYTVPSGTTASPQVNSATVSSPTSDPDTTNNTGSDSNTVLTSADLSITKDDGVTSVTAGDGVTYTYTFTVHNAGPSEAQSLSFSDSWPAGFARGGLPAGCANVGSGPDFSCNLGTMVAGATLTRTVSYPVPSGPPPRPTPHPAPPRQQHRAVGHPRQPTGQLGHRQQSDQRSRHHQQHRLRLEHGADQRRPVDRQGRRGDQRHRR